MNMKAPWQDIVNFWYSDRVRPLWFNSTPQFDEEIRASYESTWQSARDGKLSSWESLPQGSLALVIILDQFPLNMYREQALSFSTEAAAREVADRAIAHGQDAELDETGKMFLYLPYMHSENMADQDRAVALYEAAGMENNIRYANHHRDIVHRFGRFPHRNAALGRECTDEERAYLNSKEAFHG